MTEALDVYLGNSLAGRLTEDRGKLSFAYEKSWINSENFVPLSVTMPPTLDAYSDETARPFFENLLPEGEIRAAIAKLKRVSERNTFGLLGEIGGDCAGAVSLWPIGATPPQNAGYEPLSDQRLQEVLSEMQQRPLLVVDDEIRLSLAGAQNKLPVYYVDKQLSLPKGGAASSHILKPGTPDFEHMTANEHFCMRLASALGLTVPDSELLRKSQPLYLIKRYDRFRHTDGALHRYHQIDFCQALNFPSHKKYEHEGGPSLSACFEVITRFSSQPAKDRQSLIGWVIFNFVIGNADAHAKNLSLLITQDGVKLAPFYDQLSTAIYDKLTDKFALRIGGENRPEWIKKHHWDDLAKVSGANPRILWQQMKTLANAAPNAAQQLADQIQWESNERATIDRILKTVSARATYLSRMQE
jgi:serine/threonine-protein kinase HipA